MSFHDEIDGFICSAYVSRIGFRLICRDPSVDQAFDLIEDVECDVSDAFLLAKFDRTRREMLSAPIPVWTRPEDVSGEIPWRTLHDRSE